MFNQLTWKRIMTGAIAFTLVAGAATPILTKQVPVVSAAETGITPFTDIPAGLYAEKHIYRLSLQQIVKGYENKNTGEFTFRYNNTISQEEAVIMAIRFAGLEHKLDMNQLVFFQENFYVKEDYKPYIELAFEEGLLNRVEEYQNADAEPDTKWGMKPASREWVTKLIINTIGAQEKAQELSNSGSAFSDIAEIDRKYVGYVNAAVELGLVKGITEAKFGPKLAINRASFATILSRAQKDFPIEVAGQHYGVITALTEHYVTIYEDGKESTYSIDRTTGFYNYDSDFAIEKDTVEQYTKAAVIVVNGEAKFIEIQGDTRYIEETIAPVGRVNTSSKVIYLWIDDNPLPISYDDALIIKDSSGKQLTLADLKENTLVKVIQDTYRPASKVISVEVITEGEDAKTTVSGTFVSYIKDNNMITINTDKGLVSKYLTKSPVINIPFVKNANLGNLIEHADKVTITMNSKDEVIDINVPDIDYQSIYLPNIVNYDADKDLLTVLDATGIRAEVLFLSDSTRYLMDGALVDRSIIGTSPIDWKGLLLRYAEVDGKKHIVYFDMLSELDVVIETMNLYDKEAEVLLPDGVTTILGFSKASVKSLTNPDATLLSIKDGVNVRIDLDTKTGEISNFRLYEVHPMTIASVSTATKQINFKLGNKVYSALFDEIEAVDADGKQIAFADLKVNKNVIVTFAGDRIVRAILQ